MTVHGEIHKRSDMKVMDGVVRRLQVKRKDSSIDLIEIYGIFYLKAMTTTLLIRPYRVIESLMKDGIPWDQSRGHNVIMEAPP
jgi:hypothetical protein